jgi:hypothetical protein
MILPLAIGIGAMFVSLLSYGMATALLVQIIVGMITVAMRGLCSGRTSW